MLTNLIYFVLPITGPVKEDKTIYSAFLEKEQSASASRQTNGPNNAANKKPVVQKKKKPDEGKKNDKVIPLDTAISQVLIC